MIAAFPCSPFLRPSHHAARRGWQAIMEGPGDRMESIYRNPEAVPVTDRAPKAAPPAKPAHPPGFPNRGTGGGRVALRVITFCLRTQALLLDAAQLRRCFNTSDTRAALTERVVRWALGSPQDPGAKEISSTWKISEASGWYWAKELAVIRALAAEKRLSYDAVPS